MHADKNALPDIDQLIATIADYINDYEPTSTVAFDTARWCLLDSIGCAILALNYPECTKLLGPMHAESLYPNGARVLGAPYVLDPIKASFDNTMLIRYLDYNDTWLAAEWGHPSDNFGALLAVCDSLSRQFAHNNQPEITVKQLLAAAIKAYEIQGIMALDNCFNRMGLDHVILVKLATAGVVCKLLGGSKEQIISALSHVFVDGQALRTYRHAPNTMSRKSWAAGDAASRGVWLAHVALKNEAPLPSVLSAPTWGFEAIYNDGKALTLRQPLETYVMENILFKVSYPAEFHAQTAVEAALQLHADVKDHLDQIKTIRIDTQESACRIISKTGPLHNPADRDHCLQYMVAVALIFGELKAEHYLDATASDPRIDQLREKMAVYEQAEYSKEYLDLSKRSIANKITVTLNDGTEIGPIAVEYPLGHRCRREESYPHLLNKFQANASTKLEDEQVAKLLQLFNKPADFDELSVSELVDLCLVV